MNKLTEWFPGHIKPVRDGVYQQMSGHRQAIGYQLFKNGKWMLWEATAEKAARSERPCAARFQEDEWRGLAKDPAKEQT